MSRVAQSQCDIYASFATAFRNWRVKEKIPLKRIAADLGIAIATVNSWESGKSFPRGRYFKKLAEYTGLPPCQLFCVMANKCVPAECLLALPKKKLLTPLRKRDSVPQKQFPISYIKSIGLR